MVTSYNLEINTTYGLCCSGYFRNSRRCPTATTGTRYLYPGVPVLKRSHLARYWTSATGAGGRGSVGCGWYAVVRYPVPCTSVLRTWYSVRYRYWWWQTRRVGLDEDWQGARLLWVPVPGTGTGTRPGRKKRCVCSGTGSRVPPRANQGATSHHHLRKLLGSYWYDWPSIIASGLDVPGANQSSDYTGGKNQRHRPVILFEILPVAPHCHVGGRCPLTVSRPSGRRFERKPWGARFRRWRSSLSLPGIA